MTQPHKCFSIFSRLLRPTNKTIFCISLSLQSSRLLPKATFRWKEATFGSESSNEASTRLEFLREAFNHDVLSSFLPRCTFRTRIYTYIYRQTRTVFKHVERSNTTRLESPRCPLLRKIERSVLRSRSLKQSRGCNRTGIFTRTETFFSLNKTILKRFQHRKRINIFHLKKTK